MDKNRNVLRCSLILKGLRPEVFVLCVLALSFETHADWEGTFKTTYSREGKTSEVSGTMRMKKDLMRLESKKPAEVVTIINLKSRQAFTLLPQQKMAMNVDLKSVEAQTPFCATTDVEGCLKSKGFKKTGTETVNGHLCTLYEGDPIGKDKKTSHVKIWRPNHLKEVPSIKSTITSTDGGIVETNFSGIKILPQAESFFRTPKDYQSMGSPQDLLKNLGKGLGGFKIPTAK